MSDLRRTLRASSAAPWLRRAAGCLFAAALLILFTLGLRADEVMPPAPSRYFNDYANITTPSVAQRLNAELEQFEKDTSNQVVVAIFPKMQSDSSLEDYAQRIFVAWKIGQKEKNNGVLLLLFMQEHKVRIQSGYGQEGPLPDVVCKRIIDNVLAPKFKANDFNGGLADTVNAILTTVRPEYKGTGRTHRQMERQAEENWFNNVGIFTWIIIIIAFSIFSRLRRHSATYYGSSGRTGWSSGWFLSPPSSGGWSSGGGDSFSGGGGFSDGGFSGGGGDSGGGGASGSW